jgi:formylglycine-generating enzyme required for sulfatase activity
LAGLFDMHGNVLEWCQDWFGEYAVDRPVDPIAPRQYILRYGGVASGAMRREVRGGCWDYEAEYCRSGYRSCDRPYLAVNRLGIRVALMPTVPATP